MKTRIITGVVGVLFLIGVLALFNTLVFDIVVCALCLLAVHEIYNAYKVNAWYIYAGFVPIICTVMFSSRYEIARIALLPMAYVFVLFLAICSVFNSKKINLAAVGGMLMYSAVALICFYSFIYLKDILPHATYHYDAVYFIALICTFAWGGDTMAYFVGVACGKHKMCPDVSPKKTWEGAVGGVVGSMVLGVLVTIAYGAMHGTVVGVQIEALGVSYYVFIAVMGGIASILGIFGDLFASVVKRQCGIKDYGTIFPGHGGVMDRFDSLTFIGPLVCIGVTLILRYYVV